MCKFAPNELPGVQVRLERARRGASRARSRRSCTPNHSLCRFLHVTFAKKAKKLVRARFARSPRSCRCTFQPVRAKSARSLSRPAIPTDQSGLKCAVAAPTHVPSGIRLAGPFIHKDLERFRRPTAKRSVRSRGKIFPADRFSSPSASSLRHDWTYRPCGSNAAAPLPHASQSTQ